MVVAEIIPRLAECSLLLLFGHWLRNSDVFKQSDGETAMRLVSYVTLPAQIIQTISKGALGWHDVAAPVLAIATSGIAGFLVWLYSKSRHKRERSLLAGTALAFRPGTYMLPLVEAVWGAAALAPAILVDGVCIVAEAVGAGWVYSKAGAAFPERYKHTDGGQYSGEWRGLKKEGLGVYWYAGGARYEGEWRDNLKEGKGVYFFPKGGVFEGEWRGGNMSGVGVRTFSSGKVKAGRWKDNQLDCEMELWQCVAAVEAASEAALAARRVKVGVIKVKEAALALIINPPLLAITAALLLRGLNIPLPAPVDAVTHTLAAANKPLALLATGICLSLTLPQPRQVKDITLVLAARYALALALCANLLTTICSRNPSALVPTLVATACCFSAASSQVLEYASQLKLSVPLLEAVLSTSFIMSLVMLLLLVAGSLAAKGSAMGLGAFTATAAVAVAAAAALVIERYDPANNSRMVFQGVGDRTSVVREGLQSAVMERVQAARSALEDLSAPNGGGAGGSERGPSPPTALPTHRITTGHRHHLPQPQPRHSSGAQWMRRNPHLGAWSTHRPHGCTVARVHPCTFMAL